MAKWQTKSSEVVYDTPWLKVRRDEVINHRGRLLKYSLAELQHPYVEIVPMDAQGRIYLEKQFRYSTGEPMWELPSGHSEGQELLHAAKRELKEELGLESDDWTSLGNLHSAVGVGNIVGEIFLAKNVKPVTHETDEEEDILEVRAFTMDEIERMMAGGEIVVAETIAALQLARLRLMKAEVNK